MIWEIYSYWNIQELYGVFEAIAMLTSTDDYSTLLGTAFLFGLIAAAIAVLTGAQDLIAGFRWFIVAIFLYFVLFVPKASVALIDRTGTVPDKIVSNVPLSIAVFGHITSKVGDWLTTSYDTTMKVITPNYALDGVAFSNNGLLFGEKVLMAAENARSENIAFRLNMTSFFDKCVFPEFDTGNISITEVLKSDNIWTSVSNVNPSLYVQLYNDDGSPTPSPVACDVAYDSVLPSVIANASSEVTSRMAGKLYPDQSAAIANASLQASITGSYNYYLNVADSSTDIIQQQILSNTFFDAAANASVVTASAMTESGAKLNYGVLYNVAQNTIPKLRNVIEVILYAVFPIILLMMIVGGTKGVAVIKSYFVGLMWIQLWAPLYAVMNYLVSSYNAKELLARVDAGSETSAWHSGEIQAQILGSADIAGMLAVSIPMIAYAIIKGGEMAMTSFVSGATRPMESNAGMSAREVANGNISLGNTSLDNKSFANTNALKHDMQPSTNNGANVMMDASGNKYTTMSDGRKANDSTASENKGAFHNFQSAVSEKNGYSQDYEQSIKAAHKSTMQAGFETGSSFAKAGLISEAASGGKAWGETFGSQYNQGTQQAFKIMEETGNSLEASGKVNQGEGAELMAGLAGIVKAGVSLEAGALAQFRAGGGKKFTSDAISSAAEALKKIDKNDISNAASMMAQTSESEDIQNRLGLSKDSRTELKGGHERSEKMKEDSKAELEKADSYKEKENRAEERVTQAMTDLGAATPFSSMNDAGKRFATGEGAALLGQAMEARNSGDYEGAKSYMAEFNERSEDYASQYDAPTAPNIKGVGNPQDVYSAHDKNKDTVLNDRESYQGLVHADHVIGKAQGNIDDSRGQMDYEQQWIEQEAAFNRDAFNEVQSETSGNVSADQAAINSNKQVGDLDGVYIDKNGHQVVEHSQLRDVSGMGSNSIMQAASSFAGPDSYATKKTRELLDKLQEQADSDVNHHAPGAGIAGTSASVEGPNLQKPSAVESPNLQKPSAVESNDVPPPNTLNQQVQAGKTDSPSRSKESAQSDSRR